MVHILWSPNILLVPVDGRSLIRSVSLSLASGILSIGTVVANVIATHWATDVMVSKHAVILYSHCPDDMTSNVEVHVTYGNKSESRTCSSPILGVPELTSRLKQTSRVVEVLVKAPSVILRVGVPAG